MKQTELAEPWAEQVPGPVVLVVDDHPLVPMALRDLIEQRFAGVRCLQAANVRQARQVYQDEPGLLATVLDLRLPDVAGLDGLDELRRLREEVPVIVFTGLDSEPLRRSALASGAVALVCKNENATALIDALAPHLAGHVPSFSLLVQPSAADPVADQLSTRQQQIWQALAEGLSNVEISDRYQISLNTTKAHVRELLHRLGARNRTEAATRYYRHRPAQSD